MTQSDPQAYYLWLKTQGMSPLQAAQQVQQRFGAPKTPQQQQEAAANDKMKQTLAQTGGMVGGVVAGRYIMDEAGKWFDIKTGTQASPEVVKQIKATTPTNTDTGTTAASGSSQPVTEVGSTTMPDGSPGKLMSDGGKIGDNGKIINPDGSSGGSITGQALAGLQIAGGAAQVYNGYKQYQSGEKLGGAANVAGGAYATAAGAQSLASGGAGGSLGAYAPGVGTAVAAAQVGQQMLNEKGSSEDRAAKSQAEAQKAALLWIPGYGWVAYAALAGIDAISGGMATKGLMAYNKFGQKITDKIDFGLGKNVRSRVFHQSTKGRQEERTGQLLQQSDDPQWQNYVASMRMQQVKEGPKDKTKPFFGGKYATFDEYKRAGLQADDLTGVYGNLDAFKPDYAETKNLPNWAQLNFEQRKAVTQRLIDEDMYASKKGDVVIPDKEKARRIYEDMAQNNFGLSSRKSNQTGPQIRPPAPMPSNTSNAPIETPKKKNSIRDVLQQNMKKK